MRSTKTPPGTWLFLLLALSVLSACTTSRTRVAILPFENLSGQPADTWYRDAFSESLADHLYYIEQAEVIAREEIGDAARKSKTSEYVPFPEEARAVELAKSLRADRVIVGSFRNRDGRMVAFSRILDVKSGQVLHSYRQRVDAERNFLFFSQILDIASGFLPTIGVKSGSVDSARDGMLLAGKRTASLKAFESYIRGRIALFEASEESDRVAVTWFDEAVKADYRYALPYMGRAEALTDWGYRLKQRNAPYQEFYRKAHESLARAREIDPALPPEHSRRFLAILDADIDFIVGDTFLRNKQYNQALVAFRRNLERTPFDALTLLRMGEAYVGLGEKERARHYFASALEVNPSLKPALDRLEALMMNSP